jgi:hypothetical protein
MATIPALTALDEAGPSPPAERIALKTFLHQHPVVHHLLVEAEAPLRAAFGAGVTLALTIETDPETAGWTYLVASIQTPVPVEQAQACLAAFDATWWLAQTPRAQDAVVFDLACL